MNTSKLDVIRDDGNASAAWGLISAYTTSFLPAGYNIKELEKEKFPMYKKKVDEQKDVGIVMNISPILKDNQELLPYIPAGFTTRYLENLGKGVGVARDVIVTTFTIREDGVEDKILSLQGKNNTESRFLFPQEIEFDIKSKLLNTTSSVSLSLYDSFQEKWVNITGDLNKIVNNENKSAKLRDLNQKYIQVSGNNPGPSKMVYKYYQDFGPLFSAAAPLIHDFGHSQPEKPFTATNLVDYLKTGFVWENESTRYVYKLSEITTDTANSMLYFSLARDLLLVLHLSLLNLDQGESSHAEDDQEESSDIEGDQEGLTLAVAPEPTSNTLAAKDDISVATQNNAESALKYPDDNEYSLSDQQQSLQGESGGEQPDEKMDIDESPSLKTSGPSSDPINNNKSSSSKADDVSVGSESKSTTGSNEDSASGDPPAGEEELSISGPVEEIEEGELSQTAGDNTFSNQTENNEQVKLPTGPALDVSVDEEEEEETDTSISPVPDLEQTANTVHIESFKIEDENDDATKSEFISAVSPETVSHGQRSTKSRNRQDISVGVSERNSQNSFSSASTDFDGIYKNGAVYFTKEQLEKFVTSVLDIFKGKYFFSTSQLKIQTEEPQKLDLIVNTNFSGLMVSTDLRHTTPYSHETTTLAASTAINDTSFTRVITQNFVTNSGPESLPDTVLTLESPTPTNPVLLLQEPEKEDDESAEELPEEHQIAIAFIPQILP